MGEARKDALRVDFDRSVKLKFHSSTIRALCIIIFYLLIRAFICYKPVGQASRLSSAATAEPTPPP